MTTLSVCYDSRRVFNRHLRWRYTKFLLPWRSVAEKLGLWDVCSGLDKFWDQLERMCVQTARIGRLSVRFSELRRQVRSTLHWHPNQRFSRSISWVGVYGQPQSLNATRRPAVFHAIATMADVVRPSSLPPVHPAPHLSRQTDVIQGNACQPRGRNWTTGRTCTASPLLRGVDFGYSPTRPPRCTSPCWSGKPDLPPSSPTAWPAWQFAQSRTKTPRRQLRWGRGSESSAAASVRL